MDAAAVENRVLGSLETIEEDALVISGVSGRWPTESPMTSAAR